MAPGAVGDRPGDPVHPDVVVPVGDQQRDGLVLLGLAHVDLRGRLGRRVVPDLALGVGVDRARDQPLGLVAGDVGADLQPRRLGRHRHLLAQEVGQRDPLPRPVDLRLVAVPGLPQGDDQSAGEPHPEQGAGPEPAQPAGQVVAAVAAQQQVDQHRDGADRGAAQRGGQRHVDDQVLHLGDLGLRVGGDQRVALEELLGGGGVGLAQVDPDPEHAGHLGPDVGQHRPRGQHDVAVEARGDHGVVSGQHRGAAAAEEEGETDEDGDQQPHAAEQGPSQDAGRTGSGNHRGHRSQRPSSVRRAPSRSRRARPRPRPRR